MTTTPLSSRGVGPRRTTLAVLVLALALALVPETAEAFTFVHTKPSSVGLPARGHARLTPLRAATAPLPPPPVKEREDDVDVRAVLGHPPTLFSKI
jgi:hypothetical protein